MIRAAKQGDYLVHCMHAQTVKRAVLRQTGLGFCHRAIHVEMAFDLDDIAQFPALNGLFR
ncbi:hypothetical protein D3C85_1782890 [compost metagenome]